MKTKLSKTLLGGVAVLGMASAASAQTTVYITGSTAFRASCINEINNLLTANGGGQVIATDTAGASAITSSNAITFSNGNGCRKSRDHQGVVLRIRCRRSDRCGTRRDLHRTLLARLGDRDE